MTDKESKYDWIDDACPACHGTGSDTTMRPVRPGFPKLNPQPCAACAGTGRRKPSTLPPGANFEEIEGVLPPEGVKPKKT